MFIIDLTKRFNDLDLDVNYFLIDEKGDLCICRKRYAFIRVHGNGSIGGIINMTAFFHDGFNGDIDKTIDLLKEIFK